MHSDLDRFRKEITSVQAALFWCDASADRMQRDNKFLLLKVIDSHGKEDKKCLRIGHVTEPGAEGRVEALYQGTKKFIPFSDNCDDS